MVRLTFKEFLNEQLFAQDTSPFRGDTSWRQSHEFKAKPSDPNDPKSVAAAKEAEKEQIGEFPFDPNNQIAGTLGSKPESGLQNLSPEEQAGIAGGKPVISKRSEPRPRQSALSFFTVPASYKTPSNSVDPKYTN